MNYKDLNAYAKTLVHNIDNYCIGDKALRLSELLKTMGNNAEIWMPFESVKYRFKMTSPAGKLIKSSHVLVSNKGNVFNIKSTKGIFKGSDCFGYKKITIDKQSCVVHRAVACLFVPIPDRHIDKQYHDLQVNHKDGDKGNNDYTNLEWVTSQENVRHAHDYDLCNYNPLLGMDNDYTKPILATIKIPGELFGTQFCLLGKKDIKQHGLEPTTVYGLAKKYKNNLYLHKGCSFEYLPPNQIINTGRASFELIEFISSYHTTKERAKIFIVTNIKTGLSFEIRGKKAMKEKGFNISNAHRCARGEITHHANHVFKYK